MEFSNFLRPPAFNLGTCGWAEGFFDTNECDEILKTCEKIQLNDGRVNLKDSDKHDTDDEIRKSNIGWLPQDEHNKPLYIKLAKFAKNINDKYFAFQLNGFYEQIQYAEYPEASGFYDWHIDIGPNTSYRKLSLVVLLSDPAEYEGGELSLMMSSNIKSVPKTRGTVVFFPSYVLHRVSPVTSGLRKSLALWVSGSPFQ